MQGDFELLCLSDRAGPLSRAEVRFFPIMEAVTLFIIDCTDKTKQQRNAPILLVENA